MMFPFKNPLTQQEEQGWLVGVPGERPWREDPWGFAHVSFYCRQMFSPLWVSPVLLCLRLAAHCSGGARASGRLAFTLLWEAQFAVFPSSLNCTLQSQAVYFSPMTGWLVLLQRTLPLISPSVTCVNSPGLVLLSACLITTLFGLIWHLVSWKENGPISFFWQARILK